MGGQLPVILWGLTKPAPNPKASSAAWASFPRYRRQSGGLRLGHEDGLGARSPRPGRLPAPVRRLPLRRMERPCLRSLAAAVGVCLRRVRNQGGRDLRIHLLRPPRTDVTSVSTWGPKRFQYDPAKLVDALVLSARRRSNTATRRHTVTIWPTWRAKCSPTTPGIFTKGPSRHIVAATAKVSAYFRPISSRCSGFRTASRAHNRIFCWDDGSTRPCTTATTNRNAVSR